MRTLPVLLCLLIARPVAAQVIEPAFSPPPLGTLWLLELDRTLADPHPLGGSGREYVPVFSTGRLGPSFAGGLVGGAAGAALSLALLSIPMDVDLDHDDPGTPVNEAEVRVAVVLAPLAGLWLGSSFGVILAQRYDEYPSRRILTYTGLGAVAGTLLGTMVGVAVSRTTPVPAAIGAVAGSSGGAVAGLALWER